MKTELGDFSTDHLLTDSSGPVTDQSLTTPPVTPKKQENKRFSGSLKEIRFLHLPLLAGSFDDLAEWFVQRILARPDTPDIVTHININNLYKLQRSPLLVDELRSESVMVMDGIGMKAGCFFLGLGWLPDLNGTDLLPHIMRKGSRHNIRMFLLGSRPQIAERAAAVISSKYSGIEISGHHDGYFNIEEEKSIISLINDSNTDLLLVGRGFPVQEIFSLRHRHELSVSLIWNVGGLFDFISGGTPRAPHFLRIIRLEWLFRLILEPKRMWRRNLVEAPRFFLETLKERLNNSRTQRDIPPDRSDREKGK